MKARFYLQLVLLMLPLSLISQKIEISGTITERESGEPLAGTRIIEKGTTNGTLSDDEGKYSLSIEKGATVLFSYLGYADIERVMNEGGEINIALVENAKELGEVVIVGYTAQEKKDITGAISVIDLEAIENTPYANAFQALQGKATGILLTQDGQPGSGRTNLKIRGVTTINNNQPLYVIDGIPSQESIDNLNPADIESIQILKDAASASIYGSRSAGGVVVITTKKGKAGKLNISAGTQMGVQTLANQIETLNATEWGEVYWQAANNDGVTPRHPIYGDGAEPVLSTTPFLIPNGKQIYQYTPEGTDWADEVYSNATSQQHFFNVSNGNEKGSYMAGLSYFNQDGLIDYTYFDRVTGRFNSQMKLTNWLSVGENMSISFSEQVQIGSQQGQDGIPLDVLRQHPALPVRDLEGNYAGKISGYPDVRNMVSVLEKNKDNTTEAWRIFGNAYAEADILRIFPAISTDHSLKLKTSFGVEYSNFYDRRFSARFSEGDFDVQNNLLFNAFGKGLTQTWINSLQYNLDKGKHRLQVFGATEAVQYDLTVLEAVRTDFLIESPEFTYLNAGAGEQTNRGFGTEWGLYSYIGRGDYTFNDKYILSATVRYDQTSRFNQAGIFPAGSIGWWISEENFFKNISEDINLKLRASYGLQGNQSAGDFAILSTLGPDQNHADYDLTGTNNEAIQGFIVLTRGNPNLKWETTTQLNTGFDLSLWDGKVDVIFDYYTKVTKDILLRAPQIAAVGEGIEPFVNAATVANQGIDLSLGYHLRKASGWGMDAELQLTVFRNEVVDLGDNIGSVGNDGELYLPGGDGPTRIAVGYPIGVFYGWQADGLFQNEGEVDAHVDQTGKGVGRIRYANLNGDTLINDADRTYLGSPYPTFGGGFSWNGNYKNLSLGLAFYGAVGQQVYNEIRWYMDFAQVSNFNRSTRILDAWSPTNTGSGIPAPTLSNANNENRASSYFIETANYLRLRSLRLAYDVPRRFTKNAGINIYGEIQNALTFTNYSGVDPEVPYAGNANFPGIDRGVYPLPRTFLIGLNLNL